MTILRIDLPLPPHAFMVTNGFRERLLKHMLRLSSDDRYMRFFTPTNDSYIESFVNKLLTSKTDALFVKYDETGDEIIGVVNVCMIATKVKAPVEYELAVSVDADRRRQGIGYELFEQAFSWITNIGAERVFMSCLTSNLPMRLIVQKFNMKMQREEDENRAELKLPGKPNLVGIMVGNIDNGVAFYDLLYKRQLHAFWKTFGFTPEGRGGVSSSVQSSQIETTKNVGSAS